MKGKFFFIGRILQLIEVWHDALQFKLSLNIDISFQSWSVIIFFFFLKLGISAEGIKTLFDSGIPGFKGDFSSSDFQAILNLVGI